MSNGGGSIGVIRWNPAAVFPKSRASPPPYRSSGGGPNVYELQSIVVQGGGNSNNDQPLFGTDDVEKGLDRNMMTVQQVATIQPTLSVHLVFLAFCEVETVSRRGCWRTMWRWLQKKWSGNVDHVELVFVMSDRSVRVVSLIKEDSACVQFEQRNMIDSYNSNYWWTFSLPLTEQQRANMYAFVAMQHRKPFNQRFYCQFLPCGLSWCFGVSQYDHSTWFCSQLVTAALKSVDPETFQGLDPRFTSPTTLYNFLQSRRYRSPFIQTYVDARNISLDI
jgi:hypothetical protein